MNASFSEMYRQVNEGSPAEVPAVDRAAEPDRPAHPPRPRMALVVVDAQNDFSEGGALAVDGAIAAYRNTYLHVAGTANKYDVIVTTRDNHIDPGQHFSDHPDFVDTWPPHCVAGTPGAEIHPEMQRALDFFAQLNPHAVRIDVTKGEHSAAYSGFEGTTEAGVSLADALRASDIEEIDVVGVATDHCVRATVLDGLKQGFSVRVLRNQVAAVDADRGDFSLMEMESSGATLA
nr:isochorismatase family protein [Corynebacterium lactis]